MADDLRLYRIITGLMETNSVEVRYELLRAIQKHLEQTTGRRTGSGAGNRESP